jgi:epoxyqueuosine reductase
MSLSFEDIRKKVLELGWDDVGITPAVIPEEDIAAYHDWIKKDYQHDLKYMEKAMRCYPEELLPGAKTAIICVSYYKQEKRQFRPDAGLVASYARGRKYHNVHYPRLKKLERWMEEETGQEGIAKGFSDSAPVLEKALAVQAGLGWFGKNTLLIHRRFGTFTLLSGLFTTLEIEGAVQSMRLPRCGSCTRCLDACPTQALVSPYTLDAARCLSYQLIESKKPIPEEIKRKNPGYVFGCDICQDSCPHNQRKPLSTSAEFSEIAGMGPYLTLNDLEKVEQEPEKLFGSPLQRRGASGLRTTMNSLANRLDG